MTRSFLGLLAVTVFAGCSGVDQAASAAPDQDAKVDRAGKSDTPMMGPVCGTASPDPFTLVGQCDVRTDSPEDMILCIQAGAASPDPFDLVGQCDTRTESVADMVSCIAAAGGGCSF